MSVTDSPGLNLACILAPAHMVSETTTVPCTLVCASLAANGIQLIRTGLTQSALSASKCIFPRFYEESSEISQFSLDWRGGVGDAAGQSSRAVIPSDIQQMISVDYRALQDSPTAMQLKQQVLPESLKQFETALKGVGIDREKDMDQLTFAAYRKSGITSRWWDLRRDRFRPPRCFGG